MIFCCKNENLINNKFGFKWGFVLKINTIFTKKGYAPTLLVDMTRFDHLSEPIKDRPIKAQTIDGEELLDCQDVMNLLKNTR